MRSTSFTMRSASSQMSRVSVRSSSPADCSSSCAAPRMPDSGFLISCASMAASALTERAAPRWVSWRSILSAMVRSCSITTTWSGRSGSGATCRSTSRSPGLRGVDRSTLYSFTAAPRWRTCSTSASNGLPNGTRSRSSCRRSSSTDASKKVLGRDIGVGDLAVGADDDDRQRQRVEHGIGGASRYVGGLKLGVAHAASLRRLRRRRRRRPRAAASRASAGVSLVSTCRASA